MGILRAHPGLVNILTVETEDLSSCEFVAPTRLRVSSSVGSRQLAVGLLVGFLASGF